MAQINLDIVTRTNLQGLNQLKTKLQEVSQMARSTEGVMVGTYSTTEIQKTIKAVNTLERALTMAYDKKLNTVNVQKFNQYLAKSNLTVKDLHTHLSRLGVEGQQAFVKMSQTALTMGRSIKKTNKLVTEMKTTMVNTFKWGISSGLWNTMLSSISKAFNYVKGLDKDLNNIRIVTGKSADQMERFAKSANKAAKDLAVSTRDYTQGALIYYQQGDDDETVAKKTEVTAKAANVTGQDMSAVSEQLTAVWNGYQVANQAAKEGMQVYEEYVDKMAAVGAETASDLEELATAMSKVASAAHSMGVDFDQLNAQISTIVSVTRQAPESVGTALKTIYARLGDLKVDGVDEFGTKLGEVSSQLKTMGIDVVDSNGQMREMGTVMTEVASKWDGWTSSQKQAAAVAMAGKRQYNNLIALFDNWDMYSESLETSMGAAGTLTEQQGIAVESLDKKMQKLSTAGEKIYDALFDKESLGGFIDGLSTVVDLIGSAVEGVGGLSTLLPAVSGMLLKSFGGNIANSFAEKAENKRITKKEQENDYAKRKLTAQLGDKGNFLKADGTEDTLLGDEQGALVGHYKDMAKYREQMTDEEIAVSNELFKRRAELTNEKIQTEEQLKLLKDKKVISEEQYNILARINKEGKELTENDEESIKALEAQNAERIKMYNKIQNFATESTDLSDYNDAEAARATVQNYRSEFSRHRNAIPLNLGNNEQTRQAASTIQNMMTKAAREGVSEEDIMNQVREELEKIDDFEINDRMLKKLTGTYKAMKEETENFVNGLGNDFESAIGQNLRASLGDEAGPIIDNLKEKVISLQKTGLTLQEAYVQAMEQIRQESEDTANTLASVEMQIADQAAIEEEMEAAKANQELKASIEGITTVVGGATMAFAGLNGVMNAFKAATDPALTSSERLKAAFLGLVTSIPMIIAGVGQVISGYGVLSTALNTTTVKATLTTLATTAAEKAKNKLSQASTFLSNVLHLESQSLETNTDAHENNADRVQENGDTRDETSQEVIEDIADNNQDLVRDSADAADVVDDIVPAGAGAAGAGAGAAGAGAGAAGAGAGAAGAGAGAAGAGAGAAVSAGALAAVAAVAAAVIAVIAVVVISLEDYQKSLEEDAKALEELTAEQEEYSHELKAEKDSVDAIVDSYKSLQEQYESNSITLEELREKTVDICLEYNNQRLAIQALTADYEQLNNIMKQAQLEANTEYQASLEQEQSLRLDSLSARLKAESSGSMRDGDYLDLRSFLGSNQATDILKDYIDEDAFNGNKVTFDAFAEALATNYDEIVGRLSDAQGNGAENLLEVINTDNVQNLINAYKEDAAEQENLAKTIATQKIFAEKDIQNVGDYASAVQKVTEEIRQYYDTEKEAQQAASLLLSKEIGGAEGAQLASDYELLTKVAKKQNKEITEEFLEDISSQIQDFSNTEKNFLTLHINTLEADEELQAFLEKYGELIGYESNKNTIATIETRLTDANATEFTESELDSLFQEENMIFDESTGKGTKMTFEQWSGYSQEDFESLDFNQQRQITANYYKELALNQKNAQLALEEAERLVEETGADVKSKQQNYDDAQENEKYFKNRKDEAAKEAAGYRSAANSWWAQIGDLAIPGDATGELLDNAYDIEQTSKEYYERSKETTALAKQNLEASQASHNEALNYQAEIQKSVENSSESYKKMMEITAANHKAAQADLKSFGDEYKSLVSAMNDYNESGIMTVDTLTTLLELSPEMLENLTLENGKLKLNQDAAEAMAQARINTAKAMLLEEYQSKLLAIANGELKDTDAQVAQYNELMAQSIAGVGDAANEATGKIIAMNAAELGIEFAEDQMSMVQKTTEEFQKMWAFYDEFEKSGLSGMSGDNYKAELKYLDDEFDRYWDLNNIIEKTSKSIEKLSEAQSKLTRGELQENLKEQNKLLEQQVVNYQNLRKEQEKEANELKGKLLTFGVDFNADGSIANYAEVTQEALDYYNNLIERRKNGKITDSQLETGEKSYEKFKETLERYDSLYYDEMVETAENIADTQREILENNLQDFELSITIKTDAAEFDREVKDFETEIAKDFTKAFEDIDSIIEKSQFNVESYGESFNAVAAGISKVEEEILKLHNGENSDMFSSITEAQEKLKELNKEAMEHASNMKAAYEEAWEAYLEGIDQSQEKFDDLQEKYSKINEELEYQKELIELIYGPKAYDLMDKFYEKQKENSLSQIKSLQYEKELWLSKYDAEAAKAGDEDQLKIAERISQIQSDLNSNVTSYIQLLKDEYANTISGILSNFESQLTNGSSLDDIAEEWERLTENSDKYFNNVEGLYETQTLANKIKDSINDTISVKNQEKLQALYDREIEYLREKENLTQYDLDAAEARYQIALKEIALEEARENKNAMKLMRDTNGNWSYQYVADEDNIAEKQQELSDAMYKFYELSDKAYQENLESIQKLNQEYFDKAEEIATNELLTEQEKELKLEELRKWYLNQYQLLVSENEIIRQNLANGTVGVLNNLYNQDATNFENMTLQEQAAITQVKELGIASFAELEDKARQNIEGIGNSIDIVAEQNIPEMTSKTQELADTWGADDGASVKAQSLDALNQIISTSTDYQTKMDEVAAAVKEDWGENGIAGAISNATQYVIDLEEATKNLCNDTKTNLATYKDNVDEISTSWGNVKTAIEDSIKQLNVLYELQGNPPPKVDVPDGTKEQGGGGGFTDIPDNVGGGGGGKKSGNPPDNNSSIVGYLLGADLQASPGGNRKYDLDNGREYGVKAYEYADYGNSPNAFYPIHVKLADDREGYVAPGSLYSLRWGKNGVPYRDKLVNTFSKVGSFDTGGYTGEWGSDGRMAMLHEKELVLNKEDTSNILAAVNGIRQFSSIESAISKGIASMIMNMTGMGVNVNYNTNEAKGNQTKQVFNIQAEFPNANSVDEIREAILSLPGLASQQMGLNLL